MPQVAANFASAMERVLKLQRQGVKSEACLTHFVYIKETGGVDVLV